MLPRVSSATQAERKEWFEWQRETDIEITTTTMKRVVAATRATAAGSEIPRMTVVCAETSRIGFTSRGIPEIRDRARSGIPTMTIVYAGTRRTVSTSCAIAVTTAVGV